jgi:beta-glucosidase
MKQPLYKDSKAAPEKRARDLLRRMTLAEKAAQMMCVWQKKGETLVDAEGRFDPAKAKKAFRDRCGLGQVGRPSDAGKGLGARAMAELTNAIQKFFLENTRLGIPVVFHEECLHGHAAKEGTSFPQPIAMAASFNPALVEEVYALTAYEARVRGAHHALTPVVDVARDPRWGRVEETFGEDPYLVSRLGVAAVSGFQGDGTFRDGRRVMATLKHFAAHGQPESGTNCGPAQCSMRTLREVFLPPFLACVKESGVASVMPSYNEIDGVPSHTNRWLLRDLLRKEWGFKGFLVSDYFAIWELSERADVRGHSVAKDRVDACVQAVRAGVNIELPDKECYPHLVPLVKKGVLKEAELDALVLPVLEWKFRMGLFESPYVDPDVAERVAGCEAHRGLALKAAKESITLLKNEGGLLPLDPETLKTVAVIGPNAHRTLLGGYSGVPRQEVTVLDGIRARLGKKVKVLSSEGCRITIGGAWHIDEVVPSDPAEDRRQIAEAVKVAKKADVIILAIGDNEQTSREAWALNHLGDRPSLDLVGRQEELIQALVKLGKPVVALVFNGRPISINSLAANVPAILECFYLGQETGHAVAGTLFGDCNPGGKLPITVPRSAGHIPAFYNAKRMARRGYLFDDVSPLYAFGYGLSYTTFELKNARLDKKTIKAGGSTKARVEVMNTGRRDGTETVQMYIRDVVSSVTRPVKELKGFRRVAVRAGETATVEFEITPDSLAFWNIEMKRVVEPGEFEIMIGTSSRDCDLARLTLTVK